LSYFAEHYDRFRYPLATEGKPAGFREAQVGAVHAAAAHFAIRQEPGIITMPTGSGKTAVLIAAAFVLRAKRVLLITPSRLVREQIAEEVGTLKKLREIGAIPEEVPDPSVLRVRNRVTTSEEWDAMREYDVVVATVHSISPELVGIPQPPTDLFDLVVVDEAHHSPARTWKGVLDHFAGARKLLLTATPFRQDQREIKGRFIFTYDLRQARKDGIFGEIVFRAVQPAAGESSDMAVARATEQQFNADRAAGLNHVVMVRTDGRKRADTLVELYGRVTGLRLKLITGDKSLKYVKGVIDDLTAGLLDGIVCVNMLGEGFNYPNLKIAAIHAPHKSLAVTLQFIGRFARTVGENLGRATFIAVPSEVEIEAERMYDSQAVWSEIVQNLSAAKVHEEAQVREVLESFDPSEHIAPDLQDLSIYALEPYFHAKVFQLDATVDMRRRIDFPESLQVVYAAFSEAHSAAIYITQEISQPRWTDDERLSMVEHELFIFHQDAASNMLFICSSKRSAGLYQLFEEFFQQAGARPLALARLNRALNELRKAEFFNVGMRNRVESNTMESYRIITGSNADRSVRKSDGRLYHRGHFFGRAEDEGELVTIGLSSASKIWSNTSARIPALIEWFSKLARRINSDLDPVTESGLDFLSSGREIDSLPEGIISVSWPGTVYRRPPLVQFTVGGVEYSDLLITDLELSVDAARTDNETIGLVFRSDLGIEYRATFSFETERLFEPATGAEPEVMVLLDRQTVPLMEYVNEHMLDFRTADLALVHGYNLFQDMNEGLSPFDDRTFATVDWAGSDVDIHREFGAGADGRLSVHGYIENLLANSDADVAYYDHGSGEIADFVSVTRRDDGLVVQFYHCKGASGRQPGHVVGDCYEVFGQVIKSTPWARAQNVQKNIRRRFTRNLGSHRFVKGDLALLDNLFEETPAARIRWEFVAVQPGLLREGLPERIGHILASASDYLVRGGLSPLKIMGS
jgi:superfamily II DNA or RNA helicase